MKYMRAENDYDTNAASDESALHCLDDSLAVQSQKDESDINTIVRRFGLTGQLPTNVRVPLDEEFVDVMDYRSALDAIRQADASFYRMPAGIRARFDNDPAAFVEFCSDSSNLDEMRKMGLAVPAVVVDTSTGEISRP
ncbi:MAG: internal scaffolding protein [Microvirus sp.]|nr:MAG: internal scaffolding protein [Microvirus sp.]